MADTLLFNSRGAQRFMGFVFLDCAFGMLIGWVCKDHVLCCETDVSLVPWDPNYCPR